MKTVKNILLILMTWRWLKMDILLLEKALNTIKVIATLAAALSLLIPAIMSINWVPGLVLVALKIRDKRKIT